MNFFHPKSTIVTVPRKANSHSLLHRRQSTSRDCGTLALLQRLASARANGVVMHASESLRLKRLVAAANKVRVLAWVGTGSSCVFLAAVERIAKRALVAVAAGALAIGIAASAAGYGRAALWIWGIGTAPVAAGLVVSMIRDVLGGRVGVDAIALVSMLAALVLGQTLAGVVIAIMYAGGNVLEDFAIGRAQRELKTLVNRAPRVAHCLRDGMVEDVPIEKIAVGDTILVRAGEIVPIDGVVTSGGTMLDEAA